MKILFLANRVPFPPHRGDKLKIHNLGRRLQKEHELVLLCFAEHKNELAYQFELEKIFKEVHIIYLPKWKSWLQCGLAFFTKLPFQLAYFKSAKMHKALRHLVRKHTFDAIHTQHLRMSQYTQLMSSIPRILDLPDAYSLYWQRRTNSQRPWINQLLDSMESKRVVAAEKVVNQFDLNLACSVEDMNHLEKVHPKAKFRLLINGVDLTTFKYRSHNYENADHLLFTGNMDYAPNVDAVIYFVEEMWPILSKEFPNLIFTIAGQRPIAKVLALKNDRIRVTGFVPDISEMYEKASVVIAPLRFGAGTQNKVIEAMAMGVPVVCTDIGFEGLQINSGEGVIHAPQKEQFVMAVKQLLNSKIEREIVGQNGLNIAKSRYSWESVSATLNGYFNDIV